MTKPGALTDPWPGLDKVPMTAVAKAADLNLWQVRKAQQEGLVTPLDQRGPNGRLLLSKDDALFLLMAAVAAMAAGVALVVAARVLQSIPQVTAAAMPRAA